MKRKFNIILSTIQIIVRKYYIVFLILTICQVNTYAQDIVITKDGCSISDKSLDKLFQEYAAECFDDATYEGMEGDLDDLKEQCTSSYKSEFDNDQYLNLIKFIVSYIPIQHSSLQNNVFDSYGIPVFDSLYLIINVPIETQIVNFVFTFEKSSDDNEYICKDLLSYNAQRWTFELNFVNYTIAEEMGIPTITNVNGKKLYFSGTCMNAFAGVGKDREGFFHITGHDDEVVDLYLDNLNIKTQDKELTSTSTSETLSGCLKGMSSPFAIGSDGEFAGFTARFHIAGDNQLIGGAKTTINSDDDLIGAVLTSILDFVGSPIAIRPIPDNDDQINTYAARKTHLTFDDIWPSSATDETQTYRTNGFLDLKVENNLGTPSIDLGNENGTCTFDGGQYKLHTPRTNSMFYVCSMAICYKTSTMMGATFYGLGSSASKGVGNKEGTMNEKDVVIKDGTFTTYSAKDDPQGIDVVLNGWYNDYTDLRLPYNTIITGGTFNNCDVYACDASAEIGIAPQNGKTDNEGNLQRLCKIPIVVDEKNIDKDNGGLLKIDPETDNYPDLIGYGINSLTPVYSKEDYKWYIYPYLHHENCGAVSGNYVHNWITVIPQMGYQGLLTMGGDVQVYPTTNGIKQDNSYLLYTRLSEYTKQYGGVTLAGFYVNIDKALSYGSTPQKEFSNIINEGSYEIKDGIYMMLSFNSNEWVTMVAPYDIANIYVLETTDYQLGKDPIEGPDETLKEFLARQGKADGDLAQTIVTSLCPDILSGKGSGIHMSLLDICRKQLKRDPFKLIPYNPAMEGHDASQAHFYLYEQVLESPTAEILDVPHGIGTWDFSTNATDYSDNWTFVTPKTVKPKEYNYTTPEGEVLSESEQVEVWMKKGRIYSFFLPSGNDKYWDGKYLIFEGYGPQTLSGSDEIKSFERPSKGEVDETEILLQGNITFHNDTIKKGESIYLPQRNIENGIINYEFVKHNSNEEYVNLPGQVYAVLSPTNTEAIDKITREGKPISLARQNPTNDSDLQTSVPHISDASLKVYASEQTIIMQAFAEQEISLISIDGRVLWSGMLHDGDIKQFSVAQGVYLVQATDGTAKVLVE